MKALELIKKNLDVEHPEVKEAITELEELTAPKTCKGCYHSTIFGESFRVCQCLYLINEDGEPTSVVPNEFHCDLYEPKVSE